MPAPFASLSRADVAGFRRVAAWAIAAAIAALTSPAAVAARRQSTVPHPPGVAPPAWMTHDSVVHPRTHACARTPAPRRPAPPALNSWRRPGPVPTRTVTGRFGPEQAVALRGIVDLTWSRDGRRLAFVVQ